MGSDGEAVIETKVIPLYRKKRKQTTGGSREKIKYESRNYPQCVRFIACRICKNVRVNKAFSAIFALAWKTSCGKG